MSIYELDFGKHKGKTFNEIPYEYLKWLMAIDINFDDDEEKLIISDRRDRRCTYLWNEKSEVIRLAREYRKKQNKCFHCSRKLVPIGNARFNGTNHDDWNSRILHKSCWKKLLVQKRHEIEEESD